MKILHTADWHFRPDAREMLFASIDTIRETVRREEVDLVALAGDLFDRVVHNSAAAGLPELAKRIRDLLDLCPIVAVRGTPSHDVDGCYDVLTTIDAEYELTMLEPGVAYCLTDHGSVCRIDEATDRGAKPRLLILGCPEASKEWFLRDKNGLGREEAAQAVVGGMQELLLGLGSLRRQYPALPTVMVYHGQVAGATLASGQALRPGGIQIGRDDLALVGADYYALGDIHLAQQISDLPAYYAGSAYPCNWGETDIKGAWLVDLPADRGLDMTVTRIPFPHPPRAKITTVWGEEIPDVEGYQIWAVIKRDRPLEGDLAKHERIILDKLIDAGALDGSRVTIEIAPTETVRAGEIREAARLRDKVRVWAANSSLEVPESVLLKADQLEDQARAAGVSTEALDVVVNRLVLRGAVGIHKGLGVDEIELDLDRFEDGLIALVAPNGSGKTTLLENLHVFSEMLTRPKSLQSHFALRDSFRDLRLTDRRSGDSYRSWIQIDAQGACDYHLYRNGEPLVNGRKADYEAATARLFGSASMFKRSAYIGRPNGRNPELADLTKGEKKELFAQLGGLEPLQFAAGSASESAKALAEQLVADRREIEVLERETAEAPDYQAALEKGRRDLTVARQQLAAVEDGGRQLKAQADALRARVDAHSRTEVELNGHRNRVVTLGHERGNAEQAIIALQRAQQRRPDLEQQLAEYDGLKAQEEALREARTGVLLERERVQSQHRDAIKAHEQKRREIEAKRAEIAQKVTDLDRKRDALLLVVDHLQEKLSHPIECPACHHRFVLGGERDVEVLAEKQQAVADIDVDLAEQDRLTAGAAEELAAHMATLPPEPPLPAFDDASLRELGAKLEACDIRGLRAALEQASRAEAAIVEKRARVEEIGAEIRKLQAWQRELEERLDPKAQQEYASAAAALEEAQKHWREAKADVARLEAQVTGLENQVAELKNRCRKLEEKRQAAAAAAAEQREWDLLARAFGPDGIQALELDAMAPELQATVNRLLAVAREAHEGIPFDQVRIDTTRLGGKGGGRHQIEDFLIYCHDTRDDSWTEISMISGGESVWIREALYEAFAVRRAQTSGLRFATVIADEADGALDPEARIAYVRMLEAAHHEAGRRHTIIVTHSEAVQQLITQRIDMAELARAREGAPV